MSPKLGLLVAPAWGLWLSSDAGAYGQASAARVPGSLHASDVRRYGAWTFASPSRGPTISAAVEGVPAGHAAWGAALGRALIIRCDRGGLTGRLHASTREGIEAGAGTTSTRVGVSFDAEAMTSAVWRREFDSVFPPDDFFERLARAREAVLEVAVACRNCAGPIRLRLRIPADGFAEARAALLSACGA